MDTNRNHTTLPIGACFHCGATIGPYEQWEYEHGAYPIGTPDDAKRRVHSRCVASLTDAVLALLAKLPADREDQP